MLQMKSVGSSSLEKSQPFEVATSEATTRTTSFSYSPSTSKDVGRSLGISPNPRPIPARHQHNKSNHHQNRSASLHHQGQQHSDPDRLAPEDAFYAHSPPRRQRPVTSSTKSVSSNDIDSTAVKDTLLRALPVTSRAQEKGEGRRRSSRRRPGVWKKLLWVKQSYPDNYTDAETFLDHLQLNPRQQPYDFWPLVADSTVIVQHVCSVIIFVCCFVGIYLERVSPVTVVGWASIGMLIGWILWDSWVGQEEAVSDATTKMNGTAMEVFAMSKGGPKDDPNSANSTSSLFSSLNIGVTSGPVTTSSDRSPQGLGVTFPTIPFKTRTDSQSFSPAISLPDCNSAPPSPISSVSSHPAGAPYFTNFPLSPSHSPHSAAHPMPYLSPRNQSRLATLKSSILIYCALLGLSPILKSLTRSTTSDSIWAMSTWLMLLNVFLFDYGGGTSIKFPASLSTNAALMASTVLASRLPSTTHVFSLTLFSIEVFGLFPAFRRHLRHVSWSGHLTLTVSLVIAAGGGVGVVVSGAGWKAAMLGVVLGGFLTGLAMGGCSWWLISLQKYKNEIHGPWDPARPIIRRHWD